MKKLLFTTLTCGMLTLGFAQAAVLQDAIQWWYDQGLTSFNTSNTFRPNDTLRRDEAAKFFVEFARLEKATMTLNYNLNCDFRDINQSRSDLRSHITTACQMGILRGSNGLVLPTQNLTNAQAITIVVRTLDGLQSETGAHWADNYYRRATELRLDISRFQDKDRAATRGNVMMLLYDAANGGGVSMGSSGNRDIDKILQELLDILED